MVRCLAPVDTLISVTAVTDCDWVNQYMNSLPFGSVTRRDGVLNVAAHYPTNANPPDLGPKGYFSEISDDEPGGNGSTKLHMVSLHSLSREGERDERRADG